MSENQEQPKNPKINISIDHSENEKQLQKQLDEAHQKIGALLADHKQINDNENERKIIEAKTVMNPPTSGDTAQLNEPKRQTSAPIELDVDCEIPLSAKGDSPQQIIDFLKLNADKGNKDAEHILDKLIRKELKKNGTYEFEGHMSPTFMHNGKLVKVNRAKNNLNNMKYSGSFKNIEDE